MRYVRVVLLGLVLGAGTTVGAADYDPFVGKFTGEFSNSVDGAEAKRNLSVEIEPVDDGFNLTWETTTYKKNKEKTKKYSIDFLQTDRQHIYFAAQKKNLFGGRDPLDPMKGEPYAWARIEGNKLTVFVLIVTDDGGYEMQTYDRILSADNNLELRFSRIRDGQKYKTIEATLVRE